MAALDFPISPLPNQQFVGPGGVTWQWDGAKWIASAAGAGGGGGGGGGATLFIGDTPPGTPTAGQLWWESDSGLMFLWYTDADGSQWVPATYGPPPAPWLQITQAAYDALPVKDPAVLYVIVG